MGNCVTERIDLHYVITDKLMYYWYMTTEKLTRIYKIQIYVGNVDNMKFFYYACWICRKAR